MKKQKDNHLNLLCDIGDLTDLLLHSLSVDDFLQRAVEMVAGYLDADVCSIYLYDEPTEELYLAATKGLNPQAVGRVRMKVGEGIVGHCFNRLKPVCEGKGHLSPHFKYFEEAHEDRFKSFMVVPIHRGPVKIGAIVVQHERPDVFEEAEILALRAASSQLATSIENARLIMEMNREAPKPDKRTPIRLKNPVKANIASEGYASAPVSVFRKSGPPFPASLPEEHGTHTIEDFRKAIALTATQLHSLQAEFAKRLPESASLIFTTHFMMLKDESFTGRMIKLIEEGTAPTSAVAQVSRHYTSLFLASPHEYIREKANDIEDLSSRMLHNLKNPGATATQSGLRRIIVANQLYPSDILKLVANEVQGIILVGGGVTAHVSILCRSLHIPLLLVQESEFLNLPEETPVIMDAYTGNIFIRPGARIIKQFQERETIRQTARRKGVSMSPVTTTKDGATINLLANINLLSEIPLARELKAQGVGLYRTEFPFLIRTSFPSETEQYLVYKRFFDEMRPLPVTIRTLDVGGDKVLSYLDTQPEVNPDLGLRSIRFSLSNKEVFETQIRAILRAASDAGDVGIMFPMISSLDEFLEARQVVYDCIAALKKDHLPHHKAPAIGMMVEMPSVLEILDDLAEHADFFSVGTNDFIQYMLAVDRSNQRVAAYYTAQHPAVLRGLNRVVSSARQKGRSVSVCGEMAHEVIHLPFLLGIGVRNLSVDPQYLPLLQKSISRIRMSDAEAYAQELLGRSGIKEIRQVMDDTAWKKRFFRK